jgi:hypothetical protein
VTLTATPTRAPQTASSMRIGRHSSRDANSAQATADPHEHHSPIVTKLLTVITNFLCSPQCLTQIRYQNLRKYCNLRRVRPEGKYCNLRRMRPEGIELNPKLSRKMSRKINTMLYCDLSMTS